MSDVFIIGGHGTVARMATTKLIDAGVDVTSLVRNPDHEEELRELGADVIVRDLTEVDNWPEILADFDVIVWSAGNGGKAGAEGTRAIDRDGELAVINALESLEKPPYYLTVSYLGWDRATPDDDGSSWAAYVEAKRAVGERLKRSHLNATILAPAALTHEPAGSYEHVENSRSVEGATTSRELVAQVISEFAQAPAQSGTYAFIDA